MNWFDDKLISFNRKIKSNKTKNVPVENELKRLETFDGSSFIGKSHFEEDGTQNHLVFPSMHKYFKRINNNSDYALEWKSKRLSDESIEPPSVPNNFLDPSLDYFGDAIRVKFSGSCLKQNKIKYDNGETVSIYIVYEINKNYNISSCPTLENCLFGAVSLTKKVDIDRYKYFGYEIGFAGKWFFSHPRGGTDRNKKIFGVDRSLSTKIANKKKDILILVKVLHKDYKIH